MKERTFNVPADSMVEFAELISEYDLEGVIIGTNEEDEMLIKVDYEPEENSQAILELIEHLEGDENEYPEEDDDE